MDNWKHTIWRVPAAMFLSGIIARAVSVPVAHLFIYQMEDGSYTISSMYDSCMDILRLALFLAAGWLLLRGLSRRSIFRSATIMAAYSALVLAVEQIGQALIGADILSLTYYLYIPKSGSYILTSLLFRLAPEGFPHWGYVLLAIPSCFFPYLYLVFGRKSTQNA